MDEYEKWLEEQIYEFQYKPEAPLFSDGVFEGLNRARNKYRFMVCRMDMTAHRFSEDDTVFVCSACGSPTLEFSMYCRCCGRKVLRDNPKYHSDGERRRAEWKERINDEQTGD